MTVIIILGILSAIAAPRFVNLQGAARTSALNGLRAAVSSAATLTNALQLVNSSLASNAAVTVDGVGVTMSNRFPTADTAGILAAINMDTGTFTTSGTNPINFRVTAASNPATCQFTYNASVAGSYPVISASVTSGCN